MSTLKKKGMNQYGDTTDLPVVLTVSSLLAGSVYPAKFRQERGLIGRAKPSLL
jgi:hypothetical protein